jgi:hypothetical protein
MEIEIKEEKEEKSNKKFCDRELALDYFFKSWRD